jgi:hypothetical protein
MANSMAPVRQLQLMISLGTKAKAGLPPHVSFRTILSQYVEGFIPKTASDHVYGSDRMTCATSASTNSAETYQWTFELLTTA